jgi:hypothetical protein
VVKKTFTPLEGLRVGVFRVPRFGDWWYVPSATPRCLHALTCHLLFRQRVASTHTPGSAHVIFVPFRVSPSGTPPVRRTHNVTKTPTETRAWGWIAYRKDLHLLDDVVGRGGHRYDTDALRRLHGERGSLERLDGGTVRNLDSFGVGGDGQRRREVRCISPPLDELGKRRACVRGGIGREQARRLDEPWRKPWRRRGPSRRRPRTWWSWQTW